MPKNHLQLYLDQYAERLDINIESCVKPNTTYHHCIVIPAYNETIDFIERLRKGLLNYGNILVIVVVNQPESEKEYGTNQRLWEQIQSVGEVLLESNNHQLIDLPNNSISTLCINQFRPGKTLPDKQGVGLARKIGCDFACRLASAQHLKTEWIHTTDADTILPHNYLLQTSSGTPTTSALIYPYRHHGTESSITRATVLYEKALNYYVNGLKYAGSPYAFHTLGSCIAVSIKHYAQARGFPKRAGGEDFYLLNKLSKLGTIKSLKECTLKIIARESKRVPFGTGPAVESILQLEQEDKDYLYYNHKVFKELKELLSHFSQLYSNRNNCQQWLATLSEPTQNSLNNLSITKLFEHLNSQNLGKSQWESQLHYWFDGFKTLKFIHQLETFYPKEALNKAIEKLTDIKKE